MSNSALIFWVHFYTSEGLLLWGSSSLTLCPTGPHRTTHCVPFGTAGGIFFYMELLWVNSYTKAVFFYNFWFTPFFPALQGLLYGTPIVQPNGIPFEALMVFFFAPENPIKCTFSHSNTTCYYDSFRAPQGQLLAPHLSTMPFVGHSAWRSLRTASKLQHPPPPPC